VKISLVAANNFGKYAMEIKVNFLDNLRLEAKFDDFSVIADQPIRYKGDGSAPGPFDYFLASSALCAAYFVKVYCNEEISLPIIFVYLKIILLTPKIGITNSFRYRLSFLTIFQIKIKKVFYALLIAVQ
jgi:hypothetical protein